MDTGRRADAPREIDLNTVSDQAWGEVKCAIADKSVLDLDLRLSCSLAYLPV